LSSLARRGNGFFGALGSFRFSTQLHRYRYSRANSARCRLSCRLLTVAIACNVHDREAVWIPASHDNARSRPARPGSLCGCQKATGKRRGVAWTIKLRFPQLVDMPRRLGILVTPERPTLEG
jgi:hypothetical protein